MTPSWANAMLLNYREAYKAKHGYAWGGTDEFLFEIIEGCKGASSSEETDEWVMQDMETSP